MDCSYSPQSKDLWSDFYVNFKIFFTIRGFELLPSRVTNLFITKNRYVQLILVGKEVIVLLLYLVLLTAVIVLTIRTIVSDCNSDIQMAKQMST